MLFRSALISISLLYLCYRFSYKKLGTKALTFAVLFEGLKVVVLSFLTFFERGLSEALLMIIFLVPEIWFFIESLSLRKFNQEIQKATRAKPL